MYNRITNTYGPTCDAFGFICINELFVYDTRQMVYPRQVRSKALLEDLVLFCWEWNWVHKHGNDTVKFRVNKDNRVEVCMCGAWLLVTDKVLRVLPKDAKAAHGKLQVAMLGEFVEAKEFA
jgi:hypothetical protein